MDPAMKNIIFAFYHFFEAKSNHFEGTDVTITITKSLEDVVPKGF